jgi:cell division protein ZapA
MAQVTLDVNGKPYVVGCEDGQEPHLQELARVFDRHVRQVGQQLGQLGDVRLFLMGGLLLADELAETRARLASVQADLGRLQSDQARMEARAVSVLETAAKRIEKLASDEAA